MMYPGSATMNAAAVAAAAARHPVSYDFYHYVLFEMTIRENYLN